MQKETPCRHYQQGAQKHEAVGVGVEPTRGS